jgi:membrane protease YdiL (CAAX protease family)
MKTFIKRKPLIGFGFIILVAYLGGALILTALIPLLGDLTKEGKGVLMMAIRSLIALGLVGWLGWRTQVGLGGPSQWRNARLLLLLAPLPFLPLLDGVSASDPSRIAFLALAALFVAANEEVLYRGLLLQTLLPLGTVRAVLLLAALFGLAHLPNIFVGGEPGLSVGR